MTWSHRINLVGFYYPGYVKERAAQLNKDAGVKDQPTALSPQQQIQLDTENGLKKEAELLNVVSPEVAVCYSFLSLCLYFVSQQPTEKGYSNTNLFEHRLKILRNEINNETNTVDSHFQGTVKEGIMFFEKITSHQNPDLTSPKIKGNLLKSLY